MAPGRTRDRCGSSGPATSLQERRLNAGIAGPRGPALSKMAQDSGHFLMRNEENPQKSKRQALSGPAGALQLPRPFLHGEKIAAAQHTLIVLSEA